MHSRIQRKIIIITDIFKTDSMWLKCFNILDIATTTEENEKVYFSN